MVKVNPPDPTTHGHCARRRHSPEYSSWSHMLQRCENPKSDFFSYYGGRGITVCERWHVFENFLHDMGKRPDGLTLERINNDGNYEPSNCKWASRSDQIKNRRRRKIESFPRGETHHQAKLNSDQVNQIRLRKSEDQRSLAKEFKVSQATISYIILGKTWKSLL